MSIGTANDRVAFVEHAAAELTEAAYPVMLRHGVGKNWLKLELDLWKAMTEAVKRLEGMETESEVRLRALPKPSDFFG
jgi:hypothetical protein